MRESTDTQAADRAKAELTSLGLAKAVEIGTRLHSGLQIAQQLAVVNMSIGKVDADGQPLLSMSREQLSNLAREILIANPYALSVYIIWEPNAFGSSDIQYNGRSLGGYDGTGRFMPSWYRGKEQDILVQPAPTVESQNRLPTGVREGEYYLCVKETKKDCVIDPAAYDLTDGSTVLLTSFTVPILVNCKFEGIAGVDYALSFIQQLLETSNQSLYGGAGSMSLVSSNGRYVASTQAPNELGELSSVSLTPDDLSFLRANGNYAPRYEVDEASDTVRLVIPINVAGTGVFWNLLLKVPLSVVMNQARELQASLSSNANQAFVSWVLVVPL